MRKVCSILLTFAMLVSFCVIPAFADAYNATVTLENKTGSGIQVKVTADAGSGNYTVYFFDKDNESMANDSVEGLDSIANFHTQNASGKSQNDFEAAMSSYYAISPVEVTVNETGVADVSGLTASKTYYIIAYANSQTVPAYVSAELDASGRVKEPFAVKADAVPKQESKVADSTKAINLDLSAYVSGGSGEYTYAVTANTLPGGLNLAADGKITGTPTEATTTDVTVTVTISDKNDATQNGTKDVVFAIERGDRTAPTATATPASNGASDGSFTINAPIAGATYQYSTDNGVNWTDIGATNKVENLGAGDYLIRVKEDTNYNASDNGTVKVTETGAIIGTIEGVPENDVPYDGENHPVTGWKVEQDGQELSKDDYKLVYKKNGTPMADGETPKDVGTYTIEIQAVPAGTVIITDTFDIVKNTPVITFTPGSLTKGSVGEVTASANLGATPTAVEFLIPGTPEVTAQPCNCGAELEHTAGCAKQTAFDNAACDCGATDDTHTDGCAKQTAFDNAVCDCDAVDRADHTDECTYQKGAAAVPDAWKEWGDADLTAYLNGLDVGDTFKVRSSIAATDNLNAVANTDPAAQKDFTITAAPSFGGGGGGTTVSYVAGAHGTLNGKTSESVTNGAMPKDVPTPVADAGWAFVGWSADGGKTLVDPAKVAVTSSVTYTAYFGHAPYMIGREEGLFKPFGALTRAEAVTMLSRLTAGFSEDGNYANNNFSDVELNDWFADYIGFGVSHNIVVGYDDGTYKPNQAVTRGEFATMVARYLGLQEVSGNAFPDCADHWAAGAVNALAQAGIVDGYEDGTFRPERTITRAEAAKMVNLAVKRAPQSKDISKYGNPYTDVPTSEWFFYDVMEASIPHIVEDLH